MSYVFAMSDIHGCLQAFTEACNLVDLTGDNQLVLCGDYIHGGEDNYGVLRYMMHLEQTYGKDKVIVLAGNHEDMVCEGRCSIDEALPDDETFVLWMKHLRRYYVCDNTIFVHAGVDEEAEDLWMWGTSDFLFTEKYPAQTGSFYKRIVAGHIGTSTIANNTRFHDIYYDGESHYYIDGSVLTSKRIPVLRWDRTNDQFCEMKQNGVFPIVPYSNNNDNRCANGKKQS